jgi:hypothetical protein
MNFDKFKNEDYDEFENSVKDSLDLAEYLQKRKSTNNQCIYSPNANHRTNIVLSKQDIPVKGSIFVSDIVPKYLIDNNEILNDDMEGIEYNHFNDITNSDHKLFYKSNENIKEDNNIDDDNGVGIRIRDFLSKSRNMYYNNDINISSSLDTPITPIVNDIYRNTTTSSPTIDDSPVSNNQSIVNSNEITNKRSHDFNKFSDYIDNSPSKSTDKMTLSSLKSSSTSIKIPAENNNNNNILDNCCNNSEITMLQNLLRQTLDEKRAISDLNSNHVADSIKSNRQISEYKQQLSSSIAHSMLIAKQSYKMKLPSIIILKLSILIKKQKMNVFQKLKFEVFSWKFILKHNDLIQNNLIQNNRKKKILKMVSLLSKSRLVSISSLFNVWKYSGSSCSARAEAVLHIVALTKRYRYLRYFSIWRIKNNNILVKRNNMYQLGLLMFRHIYKNAFKKWNRFVKYKMNLNLYINKLVFFTQNWSDRRNIIRKYWLRWLNNDTIDVMRMRYNNNSEHHELAVMISSEEDSRNRFLFIKEKEEIIINAKLSSQKQSDEAVEERRKYKLIAKMIIRLHNSLHNSIMKSKIMFLAWKRVTIVVYSRIRKLVSLIRKQNIELIKKSFVKWINKIKVEILQEKSYLIGVHSTNSLLNKVKILNIWKTYTRSMQNTKLKLIHGNNIFISILNNYFKKFFNIWRKNSLIIYQSSIHKNEIIKINKKHSLDVFFSLLKQRKESRLVSKVFYNWFINKKNIIYNNNMRNLKLCTITKIFNNNNTTRIKQLKVSCIKIWMTKVNLLNNKENHLKKLIKRKYFHFCVDAMVLWNKFVYDIKKMEFFSLICSKRKKYWINSNVFKSWLQLFNRNKEYSKIAEKNSLISIKFANKILCKSMFNKWNLNSSRIKKKYFNELFKFFGLWRFIINMKYKTLYSQSLCLEKIMYRFSLKSVIMISLSLKKKFSYWKYVVHNQNLINQYTRLNYLNIWRKETSRSINVKLKLIKIIKKSRINGLVFAIKNWKKYTTKILLSIQAIKILFNLILFKHNNALNKYFKIWNKNINNMLTISQGNKKLLYILKNNFNKSLKQAIWLWKFNIKLSESSIKTHSLFNFNNKLNEINKILINSQCENNILKNDNKLSKEKEEYSEKLIKKLKRQVIRIINSNSRLNTLRSCYLHWFNLQKQSNIQAIELFAFKKNQVCKIINIIISKFKSIDRLKISKLFHRWKDISNNDYFLKIMHMIKRSRYYLLKFIISQWKKYISLVNEKIMLTRKNLSRKLINGTVFMFKIMKSIFQRKIHYLFEKWRRNSLCLSTILPYSSSKWFQYWKLYLINKKSLNSKRSISLRRMYYLKTSIINSNIQLRVRQFFSKWKLFNSFLIHKEYIVNKVKSLIVLFNSNNRSNKKLIIKNRFEIWKLYSVLKKNYLMLRQLSVNKMIRVNLLIKRKELKHSLHVWWGNTTHMKRKASLFNSIIQKLSSKHSYSKLLAIRIWRNKVIFYYDTCNKAAHIVSSMCKQRKLKKILRNWKFHSKKSLLYLEKESIVNSVSNSNIWINKLFHASFKQSKQEIIDISLQAVANVVLVLGYTPSVYLLQRDLSLIGSYYYDMENDIDSDNISKFNHLHSSPLSSSIKSNMQSSRKLKVQCDYDDVDIYNNRIGDNIENINKHKLRTVEFGEGLIGKCAKYSKTIVYKNKKVLDKYEINSPNLLTCLLPLIWCNNVVGVIKFTKSGNDDRNISYGNENYFNNDKIYESNQIMASSPMYIRATNKSFNDSDSSSMRQSSYRYSNNCLNSDIMFLSNEMKLNSENYISLSLIIPLISEVFGNFFSINNFEGSNILTTQQNNQENVSIINNITEKLNKNSIKIKNNEKEITVLRKNNINQELVIEKLKTSRKQYMTLAKENEVIATDYSNKLIENIKVLDNFKIQLDKKSILLQDSVNKSTENLTKLNEMKVVH